MESNSAMADIILLMVLIGVNAFFAMSEIAVISINSNKMKKSAENGNKKAALLLKITDAPSNFLATIQVGVTLSGFMASAVAADKFSGYLTNALSFLPISKDTIGGVSLVLITLILSYFTLVFGELVPKRVAMRYPDKIALRVVSIIWVFYRIARPFVALLASSTNGLIRLFGISSKEEEEKITEEEIILMVEAGEETGVFEHREKDMIKNIFEFDDKRVSEIMTHRTEMAAVPLNASVSEVIALAREEGYSRIPIYENSIDNIVGVVYAKDLLPRTDASQPTPSIASLLRKPIYVADSIQCSALLKLFQEQKVHIAIVVDEHGGTDGLVTLEDVLEVIVGNIEDEYDEEEQDVKALEDGSFLFDGSATVEEVERALDADLFEGRDFETIAGYITSELGRIPQNNENTTLRLKNYLLTVVSADERRILKVRIDPLPGSAPQDRE